MLNVLFYKQDEMSPTFGGIARVNCNLYDSLTANGVNCFFLSVEHKETYTPYCKQLYLPEPFRCNSEKNIEWLHVFLIENDISFIINNDYDIDAVNLLDKARIETKCRIISWIHNNIVEYGSLVGYRYEKKLKDKHLDLVYSLITSKMVVRLFRYFAKRKHTTTAQEIYNRSDRVITVCDGNIEEFIFLLGHKDYVNKILSIPNFIPDLFSKANVEEKQKNIVWCGTVDFDLKKTNWMLKIWRKVQAENRDWTLTIMGDSGWLDEMKKYADSLGVERVVFSGRVKPEVYYKNASIICSTSISESFGLTLVEGMQYGAVPIAFASSSSIKQIIANNGILVHPFDKDKYAAELIRLMNNECLRKELSERCVAASAQYTTSAVIPQWLSLFNMTEIK